MIGLILLVGFLLRAWGIWFGLPHLYHADEPALVNHALAHGAGDLNPHYFKLPAFLNYYLVFFYSLYFLIGKVAGWFPSKESFGTLFLENPTSFYLIGRIATGLLFGTLGIYLTYRLAKKILPDRVALTAAFFLAVSFLHVRDSHYVIYDIPLTTGLSACFLPLMAIVSKPKLSSYVTFGVLAGVTVATKYNGALIGIPFLIAHFWGVYPKLRSWNKALFHPHLFAGIGVAFLSYMIGSPFSLIDFHSFWKDFSIQASAETGVKFFHHWRYSLGEGMGWPLFIAGLLGAFLMAFSKDRRQKLVAFFILLWLLYIWSYSQPYERYALPIVPALSTAAATAVSWVFSRLRMETRKILWGLVCFMLGLMPIAYSVYSDYLFSQSDVRTLTQAWIEKNILSGSRIAMDYPFHSPPLGFSKKQLLEKYEAVKGAQEGVQQWRLSLILKNFDPKRPHYDLYFLNDGNSESVPLFAQPTLPFQGDALKKNKVDYVLITRLTDQYEHPEFYEWVRREGKLVQIFSPYRDRSVTHSLASLRQVAAATEGKDLFMRERYGDIIEIYRLR